MAKTKTKKTSTTNKKKEVDKKKKAPKKATLSNKKGKSATSKKSVVKKSTEKRVKSVKNKQPLAAPQNESDNPIKLTEVELNQETKKIEPDYNNSTFKVEVAELGFLKLEDGSFGVKLTKDVQVKRKDELNFELSGKQPDGTPFVTIFDCVDKNEADAFMNELIDFYKKGDVSIEGVESNTTEKSEVINENGQNQEPQISDIKDLSEYKDVPLKVEDMNSIIDQMKAKEHNNQQNANANVNPIQFNHVVDQNTEGIKIQPPISNTHTPDHNFNPTIPSQNPQLYPDNNYNLHNNSGSHNVVNMMTDEQILNDMRKYAKSIEDTLNETFQVRIQGGLPQSDFMNMVNGCSKEYTYDLKNDGKGYFLNVNKGKYQIRVPENSTEYLKIY